MIYNGYDFSTATEKKPYMDNWESTTSASTPIYGPNGTNGTMIQIGNTPQGSVVGITLGPEKTVLRWLVAGSSHGMVLLYPPQYGFFGSHLWELRSYCERT